MPDIIPPIVYGQLSNGGLDSDGYFTDRVVEELGAAPPECIRPICTFCWGVDFKSIPVNGKQTIRIWGAPANKVISFTLYLPNGFETFQTSLRTDTRGEAVKNILVLNGNGVYKIEPNTCECTPTTQCATFEVQDACAADCAIGEVTSGPDECEFTTGNLVSGGELQSEGCANAVTITPAFLSTTVPSGAQIQLRLTVKNSNSASVEFSLSPLVLPAGLSGTVSIFSTVINADSSIERFFTLTAVSGVNITTQLVIGNGQGTYICAEEQYSASGGQDSTEILAPSIGTSCDLRIESLTWNPSAIPNGGTTQLVLVLKNYGLSAVKGITFATIAGPSGYVGDTITPPASAVSIAPGATLAFSTTGTISHSQSTSQNYTVLLSAGTIRYMCGTSTVAIATAVSATVSVAALVSANVGICQGTVDWTANCSLGISNVVPGITGGLPNARYSFVASGAIVASGSSVTNVDGEADFTALDYESGLSSGYQVTVQVTGPSPGNCKFPPLVITLPICEQVEL